MPDDFSGDFGQDGFEGDQAIAEQSPVEYQPLYSQDEEASFIQAGLSDSMDHYTSGLQKQTMKQRQVAAKLRQQAAVKAAQLKQQAAVHPVWKVGNMLQREAPTDAQMGWSKPLGGEWQSTTGVSTTPVQLEQATILEQQAGQRAKMLEDQANEAENQLLKNAGGIPLSNMQVARNFFKPDGTGIWNQIVKNAGNKPLDNISFYESPYWDELRNNGASDAAIEKLQNTVGYLAARAHLFKAHNNRLKAQDFYKEMQADPDVKPFMDADAEILHNPQAIGSATWYSKMSAIKQKAAFLKDNDDARELFDRLKSGDKEDQMQYAKLLLAPSAQGFIGRLAKYQQDQDRRSELKGKLTEWVDAHFKGVEGEEAATLWKVFQEKVNAGKYKTGSDLMADFKNALSPTLKEAFGRKMVMDKLGETEAAGNDLNSLHIQFDANKGSFKILTPEKALPLIEKEKKRIFGNTDILKSGTHPLGDWVELPAGTFTDETGKPVFPTTPGQKISPFTYVDGDKMYVNKKMLKALGLANVADLVDTETGEFKTKQIPKEQMTWMTDTPTPFVSNLMNGEDFSKGIYKVPTEKTLLDKGFAKKNDLMFGGRTQMDWQDILFERAGEAPQRASLVKELLKTVPRVAVETVAEIGGAAMLPVDVSKKQALIMEGVFHSLAGDVDAANAAYSQYFSKTLDRTYTSEGIKDAMYGGNWLGMKKNAANPDAPTWMKTTVGVVEGIENVAAFIAEAALGPSAAAGKVISGVSKVERMAGMLGKLGANMASLEGLAKTGSAVFASERWFNAAKIVNGALHDAILFPLVDALFKGEGDTEKLLESALGGASFGAASRVGKGITLPFFGGKVQRMTARPIEGGIQVSQTGAGGYRLLPSAERVAASIPGVFGLEALKQTFAGKTPDQILASIDPSTPEGVEKISEITQNWIWTLLGAHDITKLKSVEEKGRAVSKEAKPETPVASKEEFVQTHAADASAVGSANEVKNVIKNPEELPSERVEAVKMVAPEVYASDAAKLSEQIAEKQAELKNLKGDDNKLARLGKENEIKVLQEKASKIQEDAEKAEKQEAEVEAESNKVVEDLIDEKKKPENINDVIAKLSKNVKERTKVKVKDNGVPQAWAVKEVLKEQKVPDNQIDAKAQEIVDGLEAKAPKVVAPVETVPEEPKIAPPTFQEKIQTAKTGKEVEEVIKAGEEIPDEVAGSDAWKNVPEQDMPIFTALHRELTRRIESQAKRFGVDWVDFLPEEGKKSQGGEGKYPGLALARAWPQFVSKWLPSAKGMTLDQLKASHLETLKEAHQNIDPATRDRLEFLEEQLQYAEEGKEQESLQKTIDEIKKEHHLDVDNAHKAAQAWLGDKAVKDTLNKSIVGWMNAFADTAKLNYKERTGREPQKISEAELAEVGQEIVAEQKEVLSEVDHAAGIDMAHSVVIDMAETNPRILDILLNATDATKLRNNRPEKPLAHLSDQEKKTVKAFARELGANLADPKFGLTLEQIKQIAFEAPAEILATVQGNISKQLDGFKSMDDVYKAEPMLKGSKNENVREYLDELKNTIEGNVERNKAMEAQKTSKKILEKMVGKDCVISAVTANLIGGINA